MDIDKVKGLMNVLSKKSDIQKETNEVIQDLKIKDIKDIFVTGNLTKEKPTN